MICRDLREPLDRWCCSCVTEDKSFIDDGKFITKPIRIGGHILLCGKRRSKFPFQCMIGPDWLMVVVVYTLVIVVDAIILSVISPLGWPPVLIGLVGLVLTLYSFSSVACTDPGIIYKNDYTDINVRSASSEPLTNNNTAINNNNDNVDVEDPYAGSGSASPNHIPDEAKSSESVEKVVPEPSPPTSHTAMLEVPHSIECGKCDFRRPYSARHCDYCKTCIDELDHHCPWCGKCIGDRNLKQFYFFLNCICFQFYFLVGTLIYYLIFKFGPNNIPSGPGWN
jgi:hypothetical protein